MAGYCFKDSNMIDGIQEFVWPQTLLETDNNLETKNKLNDARHSEIVFFCLLCIIYKYE